MANEGNSLAELAERMKKYISESHPLWSFRDDAQKAQRIVSELAKVRDSYNLIGNAHPDLFESSDAVSNCRAIAEEVSEE